MADGNIATKTCNACGSRKPLSEFHADKSKKAGICGACKECATRRARRWYLNNPSRAAKARSDYYTKNRPLALLRMAAYRDANFKALSAGQKKWREKNRDRKRSLDKAWQALHPDRVRVFKRVCQHRRRIGLLKSSEHHSSADISALMRLQKGQCACCRATLSAGYHIDHIEPLHRGGDNGRHNIQLLCPGCNARKSHKDPVAFMQENGFLL